MYPLFEHTLRKSKNDDSIFGDKATGLPQHFLICMYIATIGLVCCIRVINRGTKVQVYLLICPEIRILLEVRVRAVMTVFVERLNRCESHLN